MNTDEAGPSQPKRARNKVTKKSEWTRPLTDKELEIEANRTDEIYFSSESEYLLSNSDSDSEPESELEICIEYPGASNQIDKTQPVSGTVDSNWQYNSQAPNNLNKFVFTKKRGLLVEHPGASPMDFFSLLFDDDFVTFVVEETNKNAPNVLFTNVSEKGRITSWRDTTVGEFRIFLGLLFHMGIIALSRIQDYWKTDRLFNLPIFREYMSRNRFLLILRCLHFFSEDEEAEVSNTDTLRRIRKVINYFNKKMETIYQRGKELSLDESMVLWRGRLGFRQYIKNKRHKYGVKLYMVAEPDGTILRFRVYTGANDSELSGVGHASKVVIKLMEGLLDQGHALYMDN